MKMPLLARAKTLCFSLAAVLAAGGCGGKAPPDEASPTGQVRAMSRYSREGRVKDYLDCFAGELRAELEQACNEMKPGAFADLLRRRAEPVRGIAISEPTPVNENTARLKVEWVFEDRNEIQTFTLHKIKGAWKIVDMTDAEYRKPEIPYGTKVYD